MAEPVLYVYAMTRDPITPEAEAVDRSHHFGTVSAEGVAAVFTPVDREEFSQDSIDHRSGDLEWLGAIGYRHQAVVADLMKKTDVVPLRAFSMFSAEGALRRYLEENALALTAVLDRVGGKQEWTLRVEFDAEQWSEALTSRVESLWKLSAQVEAASAGKAFLLRKKLDEEKKRASREAEQQVLGEIEQYVTEKLGCQTIAETRQEREGAFPQINVLIERDEESSLIEIQNELSKRYAAEGVTLAVTGPWPPYTFVGAMKENSER